MSTPIISARKLRKVFPGKGQEEVVAVADLTMDIEEGSLTAFLGPNGAGKSTSLRMLTTLMPPTSGTATVCGHDIVKHTAQVRASIGYIGQKNGISPYQRLRDELQSQGLMYGLGRTESTRRTDELIEALELGEVADRRAQSLSGGQKRRADIALGLIPQPRLLLLDEPSTGLDPQSRANLWEHILQMRRRHGMTLLLTTHYLDEADQFAERVLVIDRGQLIADDTAPRLKATLAGDWITVTVPTQTTTTAAEVIRTTARSSGARDPEPDISDAGGDSQRLIVTVDRGENLLPVLIRDLDAAGAQVLTADLDQPTLDDVFLTLTGRSLREESQTVHTAEPTMTGAPQ
ncbi:ABC transporter ATP-binding protein [Nesterenkonia muleiensis]|uniref:ABC transporter ATP-binding protein n=1 Tax=Nesterenkonia muleiensis TaxID=2282648 RepID=UPI000E757AEB|nr:ATP-binding cassette domain-containing protein [Nesterenkonia muleiensis]